MARWVGTCWDGDYFYVKEADGVWEKHLTSDIWQGTDGGQWIFALCQCFCYEDGYYSGVDDNIDVVVWKDGRWHETAVLALGPEEKTDWVVEIASMDEEWVTDRDTGKEYVQYSVKTEGGTWNVDVDAASFLSAQ